MRFVGYAALNAVLILGLVYAQPRSSSHIVAGLLVIFSCVYHVIAYAVGRMIAPKPWVWAVIFLAPGLTLWAYTQNEARPAVRAARVLEAAGFAPLPDGTHDLRVESWHGERTHYLAFRAPPYAVAAFLGASPRLGQVVPSANAHACVDDPEDGRDERRGPTWFRDAWCVKGRVFRILEEHRGSRGTLLVDDDVGAVYAELVWN